jgi:putative ATP-dependent endonuclease of OLD family
VSEPAIIRQLKITRFRGIKALTWNPAPGLNIILGGGDVGKTTVLEGIGLLLTASNAVALSESDYWQRETTQE